MADASVMPSIISAPIKGPQSICGEPTGWSTNRPANDRLNPPPIADIKKRRENVGRPR